MTKPRSRNTTDVCWSLDSSVLPLNAPIHEHSDGCRGAQNSPHVAEDAAGGALDLLRQARRALADLHGRLVEGRVVRLRHVTLGQRPIFPLAD